MLGILIILLLSWTILYLFKIKKGLEVLGYTSFTLRIKEFFMGFILIIPIMASIALLDTVVLDLSWHLKTNPSYTELLYSFKYHIISAATEELIFRGALLIIFIKYLGTKSGLTISATAFGAYHIFSYGMIGGSIIPMIYIFIITGIMGLAYAWSFVKSGTILLPLGLHLGWNFLSTLYKEHSPLGEIILFVKTDTVLDGWSSLFYSLFTGLLPPILLIWLVNRYYRQRTFNSHFR